MPGTVPDAEAKAAGDRLDALLDAIEADSGLVLSRRLIFPIYPDAARFRREWWLFADLRNDVINGWGTMPADGRLHVSPYQVARVVGRAVVGRAVPLVAWGLPDLLADRLIGADSHAHAKLYLDRGSLPPLESIVHQADFGRALPGAYAQSISFLAFLGDVHGLPAVVRFARLGGVHWYDFRPQFERAFGVTLAEAESQWRRRLERVSAPELAMSQWEHYNLAARFAYGFALARSPAGLVGRPGGATAYVEAVRAGEALRRFNIADARRSADRGRGSLEAVQRGAHLARLAARAGFWAIGVVPILLALVLLAGPAIRNAWRDRWRRRRRAGVSRRM